MAGGIYGVAPLSGNGAAQQLGNAEISGHTQEEYLLESWNNCKAATGTWSTTTSIPNGADFTFVASGGNIHKWAGAYVTKASGSYQASYRRRLAVKFDVDIIRHPYISNPVLQVTYNIGSTGRPTYALTDDVWIWSTLEAMPTTYAQGMTIPSPATPAFAIGETTIAYGDSEDDQPEYGYNYTVLPNGTLQFSVGYMKTFRYPLSELLLNEDGTTIICFEREPSQYDIQPILSLKNTYGVYYPVHSGIMIDSLMLYFDWTDAPPYGSSSVGDLWGSGFPTDFNFGLS